MRTDALIGTFVLCGVVIPVVAWLVLRRWGGLGAVPARIWLALYGLGALMCLVVLPRKRFESALITHLRYSFLTYNLAQVDNEVWEQVGKLVALAIVLAASGALMRPLFRQKRSALALGYWTGLSYGMGEALILAILFTYPSWGPLFGLQTFSPYKIGWGYVWERLWAMNMHAIMGALIGLGMYGMLGLGSKWRLVGFFLLAMIYHHFVDGIIITATFNAAVADLLARVASFFAPALVLVGLVLLWLAYRSQPSTALAVTLDGSDQA
jgi:hypothetical protein